MRSNAHNINSKQKESIMTDIVLMTQAQAAKYLGTTVGTLNTWRHYGKNPIPFIRWGNRIKYRKADIDNWLNTNLRGGGNAQS